MSGPVKLSGHYNGFDTYGVGVLEDGCMGDLVLPGYAEDGL